MDNLNDIHTIARSWYLVKIVNGATSQEIRGGILDGLHYYEIEVDSKTYWLTEAGLLCAYNIDEDLRDTHFR